MAARDYIDLALLLVTALYFYRRGFRQGASQTRKIWRAILEKSAPIEPVPKPQPQPAAVPQQPRVLIRGPQAFFADTTIHGGFGKN